MLKSGQTSGLFPKRLPTAYHAGAPVVLFQVPPAMLRANYGATLGAIGHNVRLSANTFDPQLNAPHTGCAACLQTFLGDYFGLDTAGSTAFVTFVSTYDVGPNPHHYQQQIVASIPVP